jgi:hypothetical protein
MKTTWTAVIAAVALACAATVASAQIVVPGTGSAGRQAVDPAEPVPGDRPAPALPPGGPALPGHAAGPPPVGAAGPPPLNPAGPPPGIPNAAPGMGAPNGGVGGSGVTGGGVGGAGVGGGGVGSGGLGTGGAGTSGAGGGGGAGSR